MTEEEWLASGDSANLLTALSDRRHERKLRLYATACCARSSTTIRFPPMKRALLLSEQLADGKVGVESLEALGQVIGRIWYAVTDDEHDTHWSILGLTSGSAHFAAQTVAAIPEEGRVKILRDIFGNPFRPVAFDPRWGTSDVVGLARAIYDDKAFERMPILADALVDAGCEDEQVIVHCRGDGAHVRGCWVVDAILGKE